MDADAAGSAKAKVESELARVQNALAVVEEVCHAPILDPTRLADPNRVRGARIYILGLFTCIIRHWYIQVL